MIKIAVVNEPVKKVKCSCGGSVTWFGFFSNHDLQSNYANGHCNKCSKFVSAEKELVYGTVELLTVKQFASKVKAIKGK